MGITNLSKFPEGFLLCKLRKTKASHTVVPSESISYSTARKTFLDHLKEIYGNEVKSFGTHSLRSGGASAAANNNISDRMITKHGRWSASSNSSRDRYIKDKNAKRLKVSQSLGL